MIYLLRSPAWIKGRGYFQILKIGWTDDTKPWLGNKPKRRKSTYKSHNPTCEVLLEFPGLSKDVEEGLHDKFSEYRYGGMDEWYEFVPEILDFFSSPDLLTNLKELEDKGKKLREVREWNSKVEVYNYLLRSFLPSQDIASPFPSSEKEWFDDVKGLISPSDYIKLENTIDLYNTHNKDIKSVVERIARNPKKTKEILNEVVEWMTEEDYETVTYYYT